jgi:hypothetical protein
MVRSAAHDTEENRRGGSRPRSMAAGCRVREAHHVGGILEEVPAGMARARDHLSPMLASAALGRPPAGCTREGGGGSGGCLPARGSGGVRIAVLGRGVALPAAVSARS